MNIEEEPNAATTSMYTLFFYQLCDDVKVLI